MAEITSITPQKKDKTRCNIEVDGRFFCGMKLVTAMANRLKVGTIVTPEALSRIQFESEKETALDKALTHITASMKTEKDIRAFLKKKGYLDDVSDYVVDKMKGYGFLDDGAYAKAYVQNAAKKKGVRLIAMELRQKGVSDAEVSEAVGELGDQTESARAVLGKYLRGKDLSDRKVLQRAYSHLLSKGYDYDTARHALAALGEEAEL